MKKTNLAIRLAHLATIHSLCKAALQTLVMIRVEVTKKVPSAS